MDDLFFDHAEHCIREHGFFAFLAGVWMLAFFLFVAALFTIGEPEAK